VPPLPRVEFICQKPVSTNINTTKIQSEDPQLQMAGMIPGIIILLLFILPFIAWIIFQKKCKSGDIDDTTPAQLFENQHPSFWSIDSVFQTFAKTFTSSASTRSFTGAMSNSNNRTIFYDNTENTSTFLKPASISRMKISEEEASSERTTNNEEDNNNQI